MFFSASFAWADSLTTYGVWPSSVVATTVSQDIISCWAYWEKGESRCYTDQESIPIDRYGRPLALLKQKDNKIWQIEKIRSGQAIFFPTDNKELNKVLREIEKINPHQIEDNMSELENSFQVVRGKILTVNKRGKNWYLNFGTDWKTDFTVMFPVKMYKKFLVYHELSSMEALQGKNIEVRGLLETYYGPMIKIIIPSQIYIY